MIASAPSANSLGAWAIALRVRTLWIAVVPVLVADAFAWRAHAFDPLPATLALVVAVLLQAITNLQNDVGYTLRGGEHVDRVGPRTGLPRATATGLLQVADVRRAIALATTATLAAGLPIVLRTGWPAGLIGLAALGAALGYMGGPWPIAYGPLGELVVLACFGWMAVGATYYVQAGSPNVEVMLAATSTGLLAAAVLALNNLRDAEHDRASGRRTFAVLAGPRAARALFVAALALPYALVFVLAGVTLRLWFVLPLLTLPVAVLLLRRMRVSVDGGALTKMLLATVQLQLAFGLLLALAAVLAR